MNFIKNYWPVIIATILLLLTLTTLMQKSIKQNNGHFIYGLDDAYIHMAMAKNFSQHGVWGVTKYGFSSSSSSLLWTLALSVIYLIFGVDEMTPLKLNIFFAIFSVFVLYIILRKFKLSTFYSFVVLLFVIYLTPLPTLIFSGMEHIAHTIITICFIYLTANVLTNKSSKENNTMLNNKIFLLLLSPFVVMARYEGLFLIFTVCLLFVVRNKIRYSFLLLGISVIPLVIHGLLSILNGWYFLPNSVLFKGTFPTSFNLNAIIYFIVYHGYKKMVQAPHIVFLLIWSLIIIHLLSIKKTDDWRAYTVMLTTYIITLLLHMQFAKIGWLYRYDAYLVASGVFVITIPISSLFPKISSAALLRKSLFKYILLIFFIPLGFSLVQRSFFALSVDTVQATKNIYEQQYQMGLFIRKFYEGRAIAVNDIGAICYLSDIKLLDLWGISDLDIAKLIIDKNYNADQVHKLARVKDVKIAIAYDWALKDCDPHSAYGIPPQWTRVGQWTIQENIVCSDNNVSFYAVDPSESNVLLRNLKMFSHQLPKDVIQYYIK